MKASAPVVRVVATALALILTFGAGYLLSEYLNGRAIESIYYTDLLTDVRSRLRTIGALDGKQYDKARVDLVRTLRSDVVLLEQLKDAGKLGDDGTRLLDAAKQRIQVEPKE
jgi:hypothetical protein